jgi:hypothetical protein
MRSGAGTGTTFLDRNGISPGAASRCAARRADGAVLRPLREYGIAHAMKQYD